MNHFDRIKYDQMSGAFTWSVAGRGIAIGKPAGSIAKQGYQVVKVGRVQYRAHRLAWFLVYGKWPTCEIDHINGDRTDNRICNLREVDRAGNSQNRLGPQSNNKAGLLGVCWVAHAKRWRAQIMANKVMHRLGYFNTPEAAHEAYQSAKSRLHIQGGSH